MIIFLSSLSSVLINALFLIYTQLLKKMSHIDVAPRMWDKTIAASYTPERKQAHVLHEEQPTCVEQTPSETEVACAAVSTSVGWFCRLKTYLLPIIFVIAVIIVIYVFWKYYTKYRQQAQAKKIALAEQAKIKSIDDNDPSENEDMSKYECDSDDEDEDEPKPIAGKGLPPILETSEDESSEEESKDSDNESEEGIEEESVYEDSEEECKDDESDEESVDIPYVDNLDDHVSDNEIPDISEIASLLPVNIFNNGDNTSEVDDNTRFEELETTYFDDATDYLLDEPMVDEEQESETEQQDDDKAPIKKTRRSKRVSL